ncbi:hypothetical protein [Roseomonas sp. BN140053]|uniref:hypothetical protein n=1 Tax=Roseomonas sp. BN140053 TaxID=3391898 RepID=UPI0039EA5964
MSTTDDPQPSGFDAQALISPWVRQGRRLSDKLLLAFHQACDQGEYDVARDLLDLVERLLNRAPPANNRRKNVEPLVAAHERLWMLRNAAETVE